MPVSLHETRRYPDRLPNNKLLDSVESGYAAALQSFYKRIRTTNPSTVLIGGSGYGIEVLTVNKAFPEAKIIALDSNIELTAQVKKRLSQQAQEAKALLHEYISASQEEFDLIVVSTGPSHGINLPEEQDKLVARVRKGGVILSGPDSLTPESFTSAQSSIELVQIPFTGLLTMPRGWRKRE